MATLSIISVPIGNSGDITLRAIETLRNATIILCEDLKPARRLLHDLKIEKELLPLNEHTEKTASAEALELLRAGKDLALISDAGTPLVADPGQHLVRLAIANGMRVTAVPGASSILAALAVSGFESSRFNFAGFLPREREERKQAARKLAAREETIVLLEAPYRLAQLLDDLVAGFGEAREACVASELTTDQERVDRGTLLALRDQFRARPFKGEFAVVIQGAQRPGAARRVAARTPHRER
ncbi:MAG: 16S rRNA (cytidine(1402)-2'-O)-methyltransferase [Bacteroidota bacterium]|nr:16S rRNA (cytidine(1402)-2'-O)-methyltransferase [Bacteroidota bacterium]MDP4234142.1 16S rRNA (cytidine(1402)-2'-O)-methyltransferase [Bacteroidota bacterium]MDP4244079.1 16S rRNA (cytidine(1402)-2'-O)-methyltransferase [Bacteroidota bacterium]MDP4289233.1 16S rRNA (cytidine(1402)-2'-O)-methyltransferase [Bacteroidota bacterium]